MLLYTNFMRWEVGFPPKYFVFLLQLFKAATIWYFSQVRDYCPSIWGELKWSHLSTEVTAASRNVFCGAAGRHLSSTQRPVSVSGCPLSVLCYWVPPFPTCFPLYKRDFSPQRWALACSECFRCQTSCFPLSNMTQPATHCISEWHHGIQLRTAGEKWLWEPRDLCLPPLPSSEVFFWRCWKRSLRVCVIFAQKRGLAN